MYQATCRLAGFQRCSISARPSAKTRESQSVASSHRFAQDDLNERRASANQVDDARGWVRRTWSRRRRPAPVAGASSASWRGVESTRIAWPV